MKNMIVPVIVVAAMAMAMSFRIDDNKGLARVNKIMGKEVYVLSEPLREYKVVEKLTTSLTTSLVGRSTIQKQMQEVITRAINRVEKGKLNDFDAAITDDGDVVVLVKFKE